MLTIGNFRDLCDVLHKSQELLVKNGQHLDTVLEMLDLQQHSLAMLEVSLRFFVILCININVVLIKYTFMMHY